MASRTSTGLSMGITLTIFILLAVAGFVTTMVFFAAKQAAERDLRDLQAEQSEIIAGAERGNSTVQAYLDRAGDARQSLVGYLISELQASMATAGGNANLTHAQLTERISSSTELSGGSLLDRVDRLQARLASEERAREEAEGARDRAAEDLRAEAERIRGLEEELRRDQDRTQGQIDQAFDGITAYERGVQDVIANVEARVTDLEAEQSAETAEYQDRIAALEQDILVLRDRLERASGIARPEVFRPTDEFALVDAQVVAVQPQENAVTLSIGSNQKVTIGLTFSVYSDANVIRPDADGNYPRGKATLEVIRVTPTSATARILNASQGNPVVAGDVVANPLYDPDKVYKFVVYGNFDTNRDGRATRFEADRVASLVRQWGGTTVDDITGDLDFLVLGRQPVLPPQPGPGAPLEAVQEYVRLQSIVSRYEELFERAQRTNIPVLNENRLYTLIGAFPR